MNEAWNRSENNRIHVTFYCLHGRGPHPICATWEEKNWIGSLDLCSLNAALIKLDSDWRHIQCNIRNITSNDAENNLGGIQR